MSVLLPPPVAPAPLERHLEAAAEDLRGQWAAALRTGDFRAVDRLVEASHAVQRALVALQADDGQGGAPVTFGPTPADGPGVMIDLTEEASMQASVGDRIVIKGHRVGEPDRDCEVLEVHGPDGGAPYLVRWEDADHASLFFPGSDATVQHFEHADG